MTRGDNFACSLSLIATIKKDKQNKLIDDEKTKWNKNNLFIEKQIYNVSSDYTKRNKYFFAKSFQNRTMQR